MDNNYLHLGFSQATDRSLDCDRNIYTITTTGNTVSMQIMFNLTAPDEV